MIAITTYGSRVTFHDSYITTFGSSATFHLIQQNLSSFSIVVFLTFGSRGHLLLAAGVSTVVVILVSTPPPADSRSAKSISINMSSAVFPRVKVTEDTGTDWTINWSSGCYDTMT